jgi:hypothetical protein
MLNEERCKVRFKKTSYKYKVYIRVAVKSTYSTRTEEMFNKSAAANSTQRPVKERGYLTLRPIGL